MEQKNEDKITIQGRDLIKELGLEALTVEQQEKLIEEMSDVVYRRIILRVVDKLSNDEAEELNNLFSKGDMETVDEYLRDKVPDFVSILEEEIKRFGDETAKKIKGEKIKEAEEIKETEKVSEENENEEGIGKEEKKRIEELKRELEK